MSFFIPPSPSLPDGSFSNEYQLTICPLTGPITQIILEPVNIHEIHENWTALGKEDAMWAVLTDPTFRGEKWNQVDFFATGRREISATLEKLRGLGLQLQFGRALDFGCGVGRLTQALAEHFSLVDGVDVSASMIEQAQKFNQYPASVKYHLNVKEDLSAFQSNSYDFIYCVISLQHIPAAFQKNYIADFVRVLKPGGVAYFQTIHAHGWRRLLPNPIVQIYRRWKQRGRPFIWAYGIPVTRVCRAVEQHGGKIVRHDSLPYSGWESRYRSDTYIVTKK